MRFILVLMCMFSMLGSTQASYAAPRHQPSATAPTCTPNKNMQTWTPKSLARNGFVIEQYGEPQASVEFNQQTLALAVDADPTNATYVASRITEIDSSVPIAERVKCWQPTDSRAVEVHFTIRFVQPEPPQLTENLILWNAPLPNPTNPEPPVPLTALGVSRALGGYNAVVVQNLDFTTGGAEVYSLAPMPEWLDATRWHTIDMIVGLDRVTTRVSQDGLSALVSDVVLPKQPVSLGFEFSVDNELFPGFYAPITVPDSLEIDAFKIGLRPYHP